MRKMVTDFDIQALIDHQLGWEDEKWVRAYIQENGWAQKRFQELQAQKRAILQWWDMKNMH